MDWRRLARYLAPYWKQMGLAIAARITEAHGGDIRVSSAPGHGCCFRVRLPLASS